MKNSKLYFASDFHLGTPNEQSSRERELRILRWLDEIEADVSELFLVGDTFDFWFEYKYTAPKGFVRFLGRLAALSDKGIKIHAFTGNHDMWMYGYLEKEIGLKIHYKPIELNVAGKLFFIGHGDGLGPGDKKYKFLKSFFTSKLCQWLFARLHPNFAFWLATRLSRNSRATGGKKDSEFKGAENEWLYHYCNEILKEKTVHYFIFGHRHLPLELPLSDNSTYINLGDWLKYNTYAVFDGNNLELKTFSH